MSNVIRLNHSNSSRFRVSIKNEFEEFSKEIVPEEDLAKKKIEEKYAEGFEKGYETAKNELEKLYSEELSKHLNEFASMIKAVDEKIVSYESEFEDLVLNVSFEVASKIARKEIAKDSGIAVTLKESLKKILGANKVIIKLHPEDYELISSQSRANFFDESFSKMKFESDERIEKGGCIIETEIGNVDGRISSQFNELRRFFEIENGNSDV